MKTRFFAFLLGLLLSGALPLHAAEPEPLDWVVAVVNDEVITASELGDELLGIVSELRARGTRLPEREILERQVLERLVMRKIQLQLARQGGIRIDENTLNNAVRKLAAQNGIALSEFRDKLEGEGYAFTNFREDIREELAIQRLQQTQVVKRVNVTEQEIDTFLANQAEQGSQGKEYHLLHILVALPDAASPEVLQEKQQRAESIMRRLRDGADFRETAIEYSDSRLALEGGDLGWLPAGKVPTLFSERVPQMRPGDMHGPIRNASGYHIVKLEAVRGSGDALITQTKARHILIRLNELVSDNEARQRLTDLRARLVEGDDFAALAKAHSEDEISAANGGDLGWINPGVMVAEFEKEMDALRPNELSEPFKTRFGWHLLQVLERRNRDNSEEVRRSFANQQLRERKLAEELQLWQREIRSEAYVEYRL